MVSGGKEYGFVGLPGGEETGSGGNGKRERGEKEGRHGGGKGGEGGGKVSRWG